ncbi:hypothetical protein F5Y13DRAFT_52362 [Hypoxylon sp. FL1857]|nr:hypothetical protein F5Y13DRAFT_52362 [Hypoxylon sp. FL1857]
MGDLAEPIPVVVCGKVENVGRVVVEGLKPEYDVVLFCLGSQPTAAELPYILRGTAPPTQSSYIGSGNYAKPPVAVLMGQAWDEAAVAQVKAAIQSVGLPRDVTPVIMRNDTSIPTPQPPAPEYTAQLLRRMRETLGKLMAGEKLPGPEEGIVWY